MYNLPEQGRKLEHVWATSWGVSTRLMGALIMAHSDDNGLVLPPKLAPRKISIQKALDFREINDYPKPTSMGRVC
jgi:prolyl-tRNA synthetase